MRIAVIGGGLSGVATAFYLINQQAGKVDLFESDEQLGGRAGSELLGKRRVDFGGKNIGKHYQRFREFAQACGNPDYEYFGINTSQLINGRIISLSRDRAKLYNALKLARLCGLRGIRQIYPHLKAILADRNQGVLASEFFRKISDQFDHITLAQFFSSPCVNNLIRPITIRMNGAEPEECYPGNFGSNLSIAIDSYEQHTEAIHWLLDRFKSKHESKSHKILIGHRVHSITNDSGSIMIGYQHRDTLGEARYDMVISALPAHALANLLEKSIPETSVLLQKVQYYPVGIAIAKYRDE
ncbi:MAG TPA: FAD-dependent oxidoreductase, partial [Chlorobaculum parvum]|nr:FAD-dependent oxidoreductase [Chlorobaculum parvum]